MENWVRTSTTECRSDGRTGRVSGVLWDREMKVKTNEKVFRTVVRPALMYGAATWALKMVQEHKFGCHRNENSTTDVRSNEVGQHIIRNERIRGKRTWGIIVVKNWFLTAVWNWLNLDSVIAIRVFCDIFVVYWDNVCRSSAISILSNSV